MMSTSIESEERPLTRAVASPGPGHAPRVPRGLRARRLALHGLRGPPPPTPAAAGALPSRLGADGQFLKDSYRIPIGFL